MLKIEYIYAMYEKGDYYHFYGEQIGMRLFILKRCELSKDKFYLGIL